jgi:hypothetical protein
VRFAARGQCAFHHVVIETIDHGVRTWNRAMPHRILNDAHAFVSGAMVSHVAKSGTDGLCSGLLPSTLRSDGRILNDIPPTHVGE